MVERQDIDALLIGSLYGELSSADEARLQAHLESHPADRTALDRLTHARDAVRRSRILEVQLEPPQAVSALLMQEAARRAPAKAEGRESWFVRLRRSFLMHPAMAAAAMLVVVLGVAGTLYVRKGDHFASPEVAADRMERAGAGSAAAPTAAATGTTATPEGIASDGTAELAKREADAPPSPAVAQATPSPRLDNTARQTDTKDAYRVGLAEESMRAKEGQAKGDAAKADPAPAPETAAMPDAKQAKKSAEADRRAGPSPRLEVSTPGARAPKDLDEAADGRFATPPPVAEPAPDTAVRGFTQADPRPAGRRVDAPTKAPGAKTPEPTTAAPPPPPPPAPNSMRDADDAGGKLRQAPGAGTASGGFGGAATGGEDKIAAPEADSAWAKDQHSRLVTQVRAGRCNDAASTAVSLSSRAPAYYQQNVETDRAVKACLPLINAMREREAERLQRARPASKAPAEAKPQPSSAPRK
jgi:hypothetical protein